MDRDAIPRRRQPQGLGDDPSGSLWQRRMKAICVMLGRVYQSVVDSASLNRGSFLEKPEYVCLIAAI
jgi:hypothetical protein